MKTKPLHKSLEGQRMALVRSALQDIANPSVINQHSKGTCAAGTVQMLYASREPAKYLQTIMDLASPEGQVRESLIPGGGKMKPEKDILADDKSGLSVSTRLLQPTWMEYANGKLNYDNKKDEHNDKSGGLDDKQTVVLLNGLFGADHYKVIDMSPNHKGVTAETCQTGISQLETSLKSGQPVPVGVHWDDGAHEIIVTHVDSQTSLAYFMNPWGELQTMPLAELKERLLDISLPTKAGSGQDAYITLPDPANDLKAHQECPGEKYMTPKEFLKTFPKLADLPEADQQKILTGMKKLKLPSNILKAFHYISDNPQQLAKTIQEFASCKKSSDAVAMLFACIYPVRSASRAKMTADQSQELLDIKIHQRLNTQNITRFTALVNRSKDKHLSADERIELGALISKAKTTAEHQESLSDHLIGLNVSKRVQSQLRTTIQQSPLAGVYHSAFLKTDKKQVASLTVMFKALENWQAKKFQLALTDVSVEALLTRFMEASKQEQQTMLKALLKGQTAQLKVL